MIIRDLTEDELKRLLSQDEIDKLPTETRLFIKWAGGNGPHLYQIERRNGYMFALGCHCYILDVAQTDSSLVTRCFLPTKVKLKRDLHDYTCGDYPRTTWARKGEEAEIVDQQAVGEFELHVRIACGTIVACSWNEVEALT